LEILCVLVQKTNIKRELGKSIEDRESR